ncbi:MAG: acyl-CoA thioesterase [Bacteroidales bacterium]
MNSVRKNKKTDLKNAKKLSNRTTVSVRFSEVDSLRIVWHGHYIKYFEDGREAFGKQYGLGYLDFYRQKLVTPVVEVNCQYKKQLVYGDEIIIETHFENTDAAKIIFDYKVYKMNSEELVATGRSVQVFLTTDGELILTNPDFFIEWKRKNGLLN